MLVRAGDGEWLQLRPVEELPPGGFRAICGPDAANLLELDEPLPVAAFGEPGDERMVDAICLTPDGGIALLVGTFGEPAASSLMRLMTVAGALRGMSADVFAANCTEVDAGLDPASWLAGRVGGDAGALRARLAQVLESGAFELVLVTTSGPGELAAPLRFLQAGPASVRVYELEMLRAGHVQAIEGTEVPIDGHRSERRADEAPAAEPPLPQQEAVIEVAPEPESVVAEPEPEPGPEQAPPTVDHDAPTEAPAPPVAPPAGTMALGEPSHEHAFLAAVDRLDHRSSAHVRYLHGRLLQFVGRREYTRDAHMEYFVGWTDEEAGRPLVGIDSDGAFTVVLSSLPEHEQAEYAAELAGLVREGEGSGFLELGVAELSVPVHLDDETLLEYVIDNLQEALPGGRQAFVEAAGSEVAEGGADGGFEEDFFAGVSGSHDPAHVTAAMQEHAPEGEQPATAPEERSGGNATGEAHAHRHGGGFARRLRRRDAA